MEFKLVLWITYTVGCMIAMLQLMDDAYEDSWKHGMLPEQYLSDNRVIANIALMSLGSWGTVLLRWLNKR